ncbi:MAG TPA: hypothetical protein VIL78_09695 [Hanamia sp.]
MGFRYTCGLPATYLLRIRCVISALINAVVTQWNTINTKGGRSLVKGGEDAWPDK